MPLKAWVGITDFDLYRFLLAKDREDRLDEVNFWQPSGGLRFQALQVGEPFLFKLHSPRDVIVGGGFFIKWVKLRVNLAWETFEKTNGVRSLEEMRRRVEKYRSVSPKERYKDYEIGCILLGSPFFFAQTDWIPVPEDWSPSIQRGKTYDLTQNPGKRLWEQVSQRLLSKKSEEQLTTIVAESKARYGPPVVVLQRYGQGTFRILVTEAYSHQCAVTGERTLPALEAAHIKPFGQQGPHRVDNGIFLRSDLHRLFDRGYVTVTTDHRLEVSRRIREEFENGRDYYALRHRQIAIPGDQQARPAKEFLEWHNQNVFLG